MSTDTRLRELLNEVAPPPEVPPAHVATARAALHAAYRDAARPRPVGLRRPSFAWATATVAAAVVIGALLLPGSSPSVDASLADIARATRELDPQQLPAGSFVYSHLETVAQAGWQMEESGLEAAYLLVETHDHWTLGSAEEVVTTVDRPIFFDPETEAAYYAANRNLEDRVGETFTSRSGDIDNVRDITNWSDEPATLREQIDTELALRIDPILGEETRRLQLVEELLDPRFNAPPGLRAALIEIVGSSDVATTQLRDGSVMVSLDYTHALLGEFTHELEFDNAGYLRGSRVIATKPSSALRVPPGTVTDDATWSRPYVVDGPGVYPADS